ncbi:MAG TPA: replication-relaxation family protein [Mycobacteriales bacterium]|nr:replication-relaxation family protein [Mycobacteriales bacterium]
MTARDRWLLRMLAEHRVFTTPQITALCFGSQRVTRARLQMLHNHRAVHRARPLAEVGSHPHHWTLDTVGAAVLAAEDGLSLAASRWRRDHAHAVLHSASLAHTVGTNWVFTTLVAHARAHPEAALLSWWSEKRCTAHFGDVVRPDGYAHWRQNSRQIEFFVEYDTGTEPLPTVAAKTVRYAELADVTGQTIPVLFVVPSARREQALRQALPGTAPPVPVATTSTDLLTTAGGAAGPCWQSVGRTRARLDLAGLANTWQLADPARPLSATADPDPAPDPTPPAPVQAAAA